MLPLSNVTFDICIFFLQSHPILPKLPNLVLEKVFNRFWMSEPTGDFYSDGKKIYIFLNLKNANKHPLLDFI